MATTKPTIKYHVLFRKGVNPATGSKYYAQKVSYSLIDKNALVERIAQNSQIQTGIVRAACTAILHNVQNFVLNGHKVELGDLMTLKAQFKAVPRTAKSSPEDVDAAIQVKKILIRANFRPAIKALQKPDNYNFEKVGYTPAQNNP